MIWDEEWMTMDGRQLIKRIYIYICVERERERVERERERERKRVVDR